MREQLKLASCLLPKLCRLCVLKLDISLKPLDEFLFTAYLHKEETLGFLTMYNNATPNKQ